MSNFLHDTDKSKTFALNERTRRTQTQGYQIINSTEAAIVCFVCTKIRHPLGHVVWRKRRIAGNVLRFSVRRSLVNIDRKLAGISGVNGDH